MDNAIHNESINHDILYPCFAFIFYLDIMVLRCKA